MGVNLFFAYVEKRRKKKQRFNTFCLFHIPDHSYAINANSTKKIGLKKHKMSMKAILQFRIYIKY
jgi:hypothetical protein